jgi:hypothetical protein
MKNNLKLPPVVELSGSTGTRVRHHANIKVNSIGSGGGYKCHHNEE